MCLEAKRDAFRTNIMRLAQDNVGRYASVNTFKVTWHYLASRGRGCLFNDKGRSFLI